MGFPTMAAMLDERSKSLLKTLVERYIADGQPVGSRTLSKASGLELSPATIRNVMADLEELGLIHSPHTSAGRIPTPRGYRMFVDSLLAVQSYQLEPHNMGDMLAAAEPTRAVNAAAASNRERLCLNFMMMFSMEKAMTAHARARRPKIRACALGGQAASGCGTSGRLPTSMPRRLRISYFSSARSDRSCDFSRCARLNSRSTRAGRGLKTTMRSAR